MKRKHFCVCSTHFYPQSRVSSSAKVSQSTTARTDTLKSYSSGLCIHLDMPHSCVCVCVCVQAHCWTYGDPTLWS